MTYGRAFLRNHRRSTDGATVSHSAELVRGDYYAQKGPLIRPSGTFSPRGEGAPAATAVESTSADNTA